MIQKDTHQIGGMKKVQYIMKERKKKGCYALQKMDQFIETFRR